MSRKAKVCAPCAMKWRHWWQSRGGTGDWLPSYATCAHVPPRRSFRAYMAEWNDNLKAVR